MITPRPFVPTYTRPYTRGSPLSAAPMLPYWCRSSLIRVHDAPASSDRKIPRTPPIFAMVYNAEYVRPGAALPNPMLSASVTPLSFVKDAPESVECQRPYVEPDPPASQTSPATPGIALKCTDPLGRPVAAVAVNVAPPSVLT